LSNILLIETNTLKENSETKYGSQIKRLKTTHELESFCQNESSLNSIQCYAELNSIFKKITETTSQPEPANNTHIQSNLLPVDTEPLFHFPTDDFDFNNDNSTFSNQNELLNTQFIHPEAISQPILQTVTDEIATNSLAQFDDNFFDEINDFLQNDLNMLEETPQVFTNTDNTEYKAATEMTYTELNTVNQNELHSRLASNFLYSNDFLNPTSTTISPMKTSQDSQFPATPIKSFKTLLVEAESSVINNKSVVQAPEIISDMKTKSGSSIKITRFTKNKQKSLCLSPTSSSKTTGQSSIESNEITSSVHLSPNSMDTDSFKLLPIKPAKPKNENNLLPWEVSNKNSGKRNFKRSNECDSLQNEDKIFKSINKNITKNDLSFKVSHQKCDFGKEKGSILKKAILEDSSFLSLAKLSSNNSNKMATSGMSAKDLVLSVLKKRTAV